MMEAVRLSQELNGQGIQQWFLHVHAVRWKLS